MIIQGDHKSATRMITVTRYTPQNHQIWNEFVKQSRQGTFLFDRNYMDYHQDRFHDHSLMIYYKDKLYALLPANEVVSASNNEIPQKELVSHQGLTYGGLLTCNKMTAELTCETFEAIGNYLKQEGFSKLTYKAIPWIYHKIPSEEDLYALIHVGKASLSAREISTTILLQNKLRFSEQRRRGVNKAKKNSLIIRQSSQEDVFAFWNILNNNLQQKYHTRPVHSNEELQLLMSRFPENIIGYSVLKDEEVIAGTIIFITPQVIHTQYIGASEKGKEEGALDLLFDYLINQKKWNTPYFDFGKSTEDRGNYLNTNLIHQKEGFGGRGVAYDTYEWTL